MRLVTGRGGAGRWRAGEGRARGGGGRVLTPAQALLTRGGSVLHLTADVFRRLSPEPQLLFSPLSASLHLEPGARALGKGLAEFCGGGSHVWAVTVDDATVDTPGGHFCVNQVPLWTRQGKQLLSADRYMDVIETFRPDLYLALCDGRARPNEDGRKRLTKAVDRTNALLDTCVKRHLESKHLDKSSLIGALTGWGCETEQQRSLKHLLRHASTLDGVALVGLGSSERTTPDYISGLVTEDAMADLPRELTVLAPGVWSPACVVELISRGCDIVDGSYAAVLADTGRALTFPLQREDASKEFIVHIDDMRYKEDLTPLLARCECVACARYTRAYVHHLRKTNELLAPVLLSLHNLHHYSEFFKRIREHIQAGTFEQYKLFVQDAEGRHLLAHPHTAAVPLVNGPVSTGRLKDGIEEETPQRESKKKKV